ncbi:hypothetical protein B0H14DRAFT_2636110 [Mycena olivaceomarginata]|nr:hypothetical protein B0H14DRAFT_2636110 [Mycena olivaceomarginata]
MHRGQQLGCLEATTVPEERRKIVACMRSGRIVDLAPNCCGYRVHQKALDCKEEEVCLLTGSELPRIDPATTLVNKHASHVSNKYVAPPLLIDAESDPSSLGVNKSLEGKYAALARHVTGLLVLQRAKEGIVDGLLGQDVAVLSEVAKSQRGSYCIQHNSDHRNSPRTQVREAPPSDLEHSLTGLLELMTNEQGSQSAFTALKEGGRETFDWRRATHVRAGEWVDLALSLTGSKLIASVLAMADKDQRASLYDCIRGHVRGCKTGSMSGFCTKPIFAHPASFA